MMICPKLGFVEGHGIGHIRMAFFENASTLFELQQAISDQDSGSILLARRSLEPENRSF